MEPCGAHGQRYYDGGGIYEHNREDEARHSGSIRFSGSRGYGGNDFGGAEREHERRYCNREGVSGAYGYGRRADQSETEGGGRIEQRNATAICETVARFPYTGL
eukprot:4055535-Heterocapsa_arctica.AAC.1